MNSLYHNNPTAQNVAGTVYSLSRVRRHLPLFILAIHIKNKSSYLRHKARRFLPFRYQCIHSGAFLAPFYIRAF